MARHGKTGGTAVEVTERQHTERCSEVCNGVAQVLVEETSLTVAAARVLEVACRSLNWAVGELWQLDESGAEMRLLETWHKPSFDLAEFTEATRKTAFGFSVGVPGRLWSDRHPIWIRDVATDPGFSRSALARRAGLRTACGIPVIALDTVVGAMVFFSDRRRELDADLVSISQAIGGHVGLFLERVRAATGMGAIVEAAIDGIALIDDRGRIRLFNPAAERMFGYSSGEVLGQDVRRLVPSSSNGEDWYPGAVSTSANLAPAGLRCEAFGQRKDGTSFPLSLSIGRMELGSLRMFVGIFRDLTDFKSMQDEIVRARSVAAIADTVAEIGHEIKSPLAAISTPLQLFLRDIDHSDPRHKVLTDVVDQVNRLATTVHRLLVAVESSRH